MHTASTNFLALCRDTTKSNAKGLMARRAYVTDAKGNTAMVIKPNLYISKVRGFACWLSVYSGNGLTFTQEDPSGSAVALD